MREDEGGNPAKISARVIKITELLAEKHNCLAAESFCNGKLLQTDDCEENTSVKHSRETFFNGRSGKFSTTSADDQDES